MKHGYCSISDFIPKTLRSFNKASHAIQTMKSFFVLLCALAASMAVNFDVQEELLQRHNKDRAEQHLGVLITNPLLIQSAQTCADYYAQKDQIDLSCPELQQYGKNIFMLRLETGSPDFETSVDQAYARWVSDLNQHLAENPTAGAEDDYSQMFWSGTQELGCAAAQNLGAQSTVVVCLYNPPMFTI
ncbi:unnamed protein product [Allacma fusca]|uniref:SCP domain-containing protein n=1 Tax=Allacma fusca TaxID=39272 RepID=A0A8J2Q3U3_9HEXA|nr:unnamed protein product [Allacma fusca]